MLFIELTVTGSLSLGTLSPVRRSPAGEFRRYSCVFIKFKSTFYKNIMRQKSSRLILCVFIKFKSTYICSCECLCPAAGIIVVSRMALHGKNEYNPWLDFGYGFRKIYPESKLSMQFWFGNYWLPKVPIICDRQSAKYLSV